MKTAYQPDSRDSCAPCHPPCWLGAKQRYLAWFIRSSGWIGGFVAVLVITLRTCDAHGPESETAEEVEELAVTADDREHWAWLPCETAVLPQVANSSWPANEIDYFILSALEDRQLEPAAPASKTSLLRRLKFDLHGLPPSVREVEQFIADQRPDAYSRLVERLLADPAYGERWAQHWLDLARFAETDGFEHDKVREGAWRYRDWVIDSLNQDLPYDQFIAQQLAGDLLAAPNGPIATMFCLAGPDMPDVNEQNLRRHDKLNEITSTVGAALLAMQLQCAQCHDHKYDAISQADFYRLRAVFESSIAEMKRDRQQSVLAEHDQHPSPRFYWRGDVNSPGPTVEPGVPRVANYAASHLLTQGQARVELVAWLFHPENPLTARVIANRVWQFHFGRGLAGSPNDFGVMGDMPTHPELLDWMACELRRQQWSLKSLHRIIVNSATYRQAGVPAADADWSQRLAEDPQVLWYSRFPRRRLEGEVLRDALLATTGGLNSQMGGASVMPPLPRELLSTILKGQWKTSDKLEDHARRSVYIFARRNLRYPIFEVFDRPDAIASCPQRNRSTTALQSLQMLNSELVMASARQLATQLQREALDRPEPERTAWQANELFRRVLSRAASSTELKTTTEQLTNPSFGPGENLLIACLAIFNTNEFAYVD